ncbi:origin recognition complex subunit 5 C-terminus-domain-containing protein [Lenzites betulinus]|nr:origin recognition complex subunit 5 C-terminus-domain-containing protein [Lenzites betulinus]
MAHVSTTLRSALATSPEYEAVATHLSALLLSQPPSFVFIHDPENSRLTSAVVASTLEELAAQSVHNSSFDCACVNALSCFSPRILFDTVLNTLARWTPDWDQGALNWPGTSEGIRYNDNLDSFVHGIQAVYSQASSAHTSQNGTNKRKGKTPQHSDTVYRMVLVIDQAERLKEKLPELVVPLSRLSELARVDITTIFISKNQWQDIRPSLRSAPEPYYIDVPFLSKQAILDIMNHAFPVAPSDQLTSNDAFTEAYHAALRPLYAHFIATLYSTCGPFVHDPSELAYIAAARWPGFVQPILDAHRRRLCAGRGDMDDGEGPIDETEQDNTLKPPTEDVRLRLTRLFTSSFTAALEALHPRLTHAAHWAHTHTPPDDLLSVPPAHASQTLYTHIATVTAQADAEAGVSVGLEALPRMSKFILVAAFLASTNPARSDLRMFGRGLDERSRRRRRKTGTPRKPKPGTTGTAIKIPQRLLGPTTFPLDRLVAILGVLLEENDADVRPVAPQYSLPGEYTEMEISRVALYANVMELVSMRLLVRTSPADRLDGTPTFKCGIGYELAGKVARELGIVLNDLMYEPV